MSSEKLKQCPKCGVWLSIEDILESAEVTIIGMTLDSDDFTFNSFYFNHDAPECGTTFTMNVLDFAEYINEPIPQDILTGQPGCERHCSSLTDTRLCRKTCRWAPFRRFMDALMRKKQGKPQDTR
jgi:hypothetical protein